MSTHNMILRRNKKNIYLESGYPLSRAMEVNTICAISCEKES